MYKVAIIGCENSHATHFMRHVLTNKVITDMEFVGVYSYDRAAAEKLNEEFGVYVADSYDEFVGKVDGVVITARHGNNHYKYAKPYIESGIPMFIDKPITTTEEDARALMAELKANNVRMCGGTSCIFSKRIQTLKKAVQEETFGKTVGGYVRGPAYLNSPFDGFFFYTQHVTQSAMEIFGYYPASVYASRKGDNLTAILHYDGFDVNLNFRGDTSLYYALVSGMNMAVGDRFDCGAHYGDEFNEFYEILKGGEMTKSYEDIFAPVYVLNAMYRSMNSVKEEIINYGY